MFRYIRNVDTLVFKTNLVPGQTSVTINKNGGPMGMTLTAGGGGDDLREGVFVTKVKPGSAAEAAGLQLKMRVYAIDGFDAEQMTKKEVTGVLKATGEVVTVKVSVGPDAEGFAAFEAGVAPPRKQPPAPADGGDRLGAMPARATAPMGNATLSRTFTNSALGVTMTSHQVFVPDDLPVPAGPANPGAIAAVKRVLRAREIKLWLPPHTEKETGAAVYSATLAGDIADELADDGEEHPAATIAMAMEHLRVGAF